MKLVIDIVSYAAHALAAVLVVGTLIPLLPVGAWLVRGWDFPRLHIAIGCALLIILMLVLGVLRGWELDIPLAILLLALAGAWQAWRIVPYTPVWPRRVPSASSRGLRLLVVNLDVRNERRADVARMIERQRPDVLLLIEIDTAWADALADVRGAFEHHAQDVRADGLGLALWSKLEFDDPEIRELVSEKRPSIHTAIRLDDGRRVRFVALHPTPPGLPRDHDGDDQDGRYDSRIRDAELLLVADEIALQRGTAWIVAGDFNDVAWSHTTRLFRRVSGLEDPRIGRGLFNTYHAEYRLLRYPVDHVFLSPGFAVAEMRRIEIPGSDHFAILAELALEQPEDQPIEADAEDREEAEEMIDDGKEDAMENGESPDG